MRIPVIKAFIDKTTGKPYSVGGLYESTNDKRIKELQNGGDLQKEVYEKKEQQKPKKPETKPANNLKEPEDLKKDETKK